MPSVAETRRLVNDIVRLRRAEQVRAVAADVAPVRRRLESKLGPTLSRSRAARILGVSQTALDRWVEAGEIPVVITPGGRREVPRQFAVELRMAIDELMQAGRQRHPLAAALADRRNAAAKLIGGPSPGGSFPAAVEPAVHGHETAERRSQTYHALIAKRLDDRLVEEAGENIDRLVGEGHLDTRYAERWRALLSRPISEIAEAIVADTQEARDLRQNTPFAGVLNEQERRRVIEVTR